MTPVLNLQIGGFVLDEYMEKSGFSYQPIQRVSKTVTTMDGTEHRKWVQKRSISVSLFEINETTKNTIETALFPSTANTVHVTGRIQNGSFSGDFYVTGWQPKIKIIEAGIPYYEGLSFTLEEK